MPNRPEIPTIAALANLAFSRNLDRLSLVRRPDASRQAGLFVLLLSNTAIAQVGPLLERYVRQIQEHNPAEREGEHRHILSLVDAPVYMAFDWMAATQRNFSWGVFSLTLHVTQRQRSGFGQSQALMAAFVGTKLCRKIARDLTAVGCPTSLT
jgi:hypothetical protein